jgi:hypothetical protein
MIILASKIFTFNLIASFTVINHEDSLEKGGGGGGGCCGLRLGLGVFGESNVELQSFNKTVYSVLTQRQYISFFAACFGFYKIIFRPMLSIGMYIQCVHTLWGSIVFIYNCKIHENFPYKNASFKLNRVYYVIEKTYVAIPVGRKVLL